MSKSKPTIAEQLNLTQVALDNSLADPEIQALLAARSYTAEKLAEGQALLTSARAAISTQEAALGSQRVATEALVPLRTQAVDAYQALAKIARAITSPGFLAGLGLKGRMPVSIAGFLAAAGILFDNATLLPDLAAYGYTAAELTAERAKITAYASANILHEAAKGATRQAAIEQAAALLALHEWMARYRKIARVALRRKPQLLEKLGIPVRTSPHRSAPDMPPPAGDGA
jgi:hypothetical protein